MEDTNIAELKQWRKDKKLKFYHRTKENIWKMIQEEGILWGRTIASSMINGKSINHPGPRYTYLAPEDWGDTYGTVLLEVEYEPIGVGVKDENNNTIDNYCMKPPPGNYCWQFSVFKAIPIKNIKRITTVKYNL